MKAPKPKYTRCKSHILTNSSWLVGTLLRVLHILPDLRCSQVCWPVTILSKNKHRMSPQRLFFTDFSHSSIDSFLDAR